MAVTVVSKDADDASPFPSSRCSPGWCACAPTHKRRSPAEKTRSLGPRTHAGGDWPRKRQRIAPAARYRLPARAWGTTYEDAVAVDVPGMSVPQNGCDETGVKPVLFALTIQAQLFES